MPSKRSQAPRGTASFVDHTARFHVRPGRALTHQFASLYFTRLNELRPEVEAVARARWGDGVLNTCVKTLDAEPGAPAFVVGTIYCDMKAKPSLDDEAERDVLDVFTEGELPRTTGKYCAESDTILLEDESGRLALRVPQDLSGEPLVTGAVVGIKGTVSEAGELEVESICLPGLAPQAPLGTAVPAAPAAGAGRYIALVSGLRVGHDAHDMLPLQLLAEHLTGQLGCDEDHRLQANIVRLVIAGNATGCAAAGESDSALGVAGNDILKKMAGSEQTSLAQHVRSLDQFLTTVSAAIPVDLMPGADDPCNFLLPQQPYHPCMLPQASQFSTLNLCTNPYCCEIDGVRVLGTSGQPLDDMQRFARALEPTHCHKATVADAANAARRRRRAFRRGRPLTFGSPSSASLVHRCIPVPNADTCLVTTVWPP